MLIEKHEETLGIDVVNKVIIITIFFLAMLSGWAEENLEILTPGVDKVEVYARSNFDQQRIRVGETPYKEGLESFVSKFSKVNIVVVELVKKGYESQRFVLMRGSKFDVKLNIKMKPLNDFNELQKIDLMIAELFEIRNLIRSQDYEGARSRLEGLEKEHQNISIIPELKAITFYMQKDIEKALANFRQAFSINPRNSDAYKMKVYLEKKMGIDTSDN